MIDEKSVIERIYDVLKNRYKSINAASNEIAIKQSSLATAYSRGQVNFQIVAAFLNANPDISPDWLIFGKGDMMRTAPGEDKRTAQYVADILEMQKKHIHDLGELDKQYHKDISKIRNYEH